MATIEGFWWTYNQVKLASDLHAGFSYLWKTVTYTRELAGANHLDSEVLSEFLLILSHLRSLQELFKSGQWRGKWTNWTLKGRVFDTEE